MTWYATISRPSDRVVLHLQDLPVRGEEPTPLPDPSAVWAFLQQHPQVQAVLFYAAWMPRRAVPVEKVTPALVRKLFR
jgi:hypothetical protein